MGEIGTGHDFGPEPNLEKLCIVSQFVINLMNEPKEITLIQIKLVPAKLHSGK